ncbi:MAG TPA: rod shape-determining protein [Symbiobacteriaceae bacterium]|nr:rod shape-determining protein [Symbiobacteriaceae bacterium]
MFAQEIGIDLGSANSIVVAKKRGIIAKEPSVVAVNRKTRSVVAVGSEARQMVGRTPDNIVSIRPVQAGVVSDLSHSTALLRHLLRGIAGSRWLRPRVILTMHTNASEVEKRALAEAVGEAGAGEVFLLEEAVAAGLGAGLPVQQPVGSLIMDIGSGTTTVSVLSLGATVVSASSYMAGDKLDDAIARYIKKEHNLLIGTPTAERVKIEFGSALPGRTGKTTVVGRLLTTGTPTAVQLDAAEVYTAIGDCLSQIDSLVQGVLERTPPELLADVSQTGLTLTGGMAQLPGLTERLARATGLKAELAPDPADAVAMGTAQVLARPDSVRLFRVKPVRRGK